MDFTGLLERAGLLDFTGLLERAGLLGRAGLSCSTNRTDSSSSYSSSSKSMKSLMKCLRSCLVLIFSNDSHPHRLSVMVASSILTSQSRTITERSIGHSASNTATSGLLDFFISANAF